MHEEALRNFLVDAGLVSRSQVDAALQNAEAKGVGLSQVLIESGVLSEDEVRRAAAHAHGVPFITLGQGEVAFEALVLIPEPLARLHNVVAYAILDEPRAVEVALLSLDSLPAVEFLRRSHKVMPRLTNRESMKRALMHYQKNLRETYGKDLALETAPSRSIDALLRHALVSQAGSVHLDLSEDGLRVRYRTHGALHESMVLPARFATSIVGKLKELAHLPAGNSHLPREGRFVAEVDAQKLSVRVSAIATAAGEKMTLHLMREGSGRKGYTLESLGLHGEGLESLHKALLHRATEPGLILVGGPAGSGKTSLLYTMLDLVNTPEAALATVEESVEHRLLNVAQVEAHAHNGLSMAAGLRAVLRQDPDVVLVGNIADKETAALAVAAAARGVMVLAGVEAMGAADAIQKMLEHGAAPAQLGAALRACVGLALAQRVCTKQFATNAKLTRPEADRLEARADFAQVLATLKEEGRVEKSAHWKDLAFAHAAPCSSCKDGYEGFVGLQEVMAFTPALRNLIQNRVEPQDIEAQARQEGMRTLVEDGLYKAAQSVTSLQEVLRLC